MPPKIQLLDEDWEDVYLCGNRVSLCKSVGLLGDEIRRDSPLTKTESDETLWVFVIGETVEVQDQSQKTLPFPYPNGLSSPNQDENSDRL